MTLAIQDKYAPRHHEPRRRWLKAPRFQMFLGQALSVVYAAGRPTARTLREWSLGVAGFGCLDGAFFVKSTFWGLLVTGVSILIIELRATRS